MMTTEGRTEAGSSTYRETDPLVMTIPFGPSTSVRSIEQGQGFSMLNYTRMSSLTFKKQRYLM